MTAWQTIREAPKRLGEAAAQARPQLRSITSPPRRMAPATFAIVVVGLFVSGMVGMLLLTTLLQNQAFKLSAAERTASELSYRASDLEAQVNRAQAPAALGQRATELGMVPNPGAVFIDLGTGEVLGDPVPVRGDEIPSLTRVPVVPTPADEVPPADAPPAEGTPAEGDQAAAPPADGDPAADAQAAPAAPAEGEPADTPQADAAAEPAAEDTATQEPVTAQADPAPDTGATP